jgi:hypothetical protein
VSVTVSVTCPVCGSVDELELRYDSASTLWADWQAGVCTHMAGLRRPRTGPTGGPPASVPRASVVPPGVMPLKEAADKLGVWPLTLKRWRRAGRLTENDVWQDEPVGRYGRWYVSKSTVERLQREATRRKES